MTQVASNAFRVEVIAAPSGTWYQTATASQWTTLSGGAAPQLSNVDPCPGNCVYSRSEHQTAVVGDWCGAAASPGSLLICAQGGHDGYAGNEVYEYMFSDDPPRWYRRIDPSTNIQALVSYYPDGKPSSRHGYNHDCYIGTVGSRGDRWMAFIAWATYSPSGNSNFFSAASYNRLTQTYDAQGFFATFPGGGVYDAVCAYDPVNQRVYAREGSQLALWRFYSLDVASNVWTQHSSTFATGPVGESTAFIDPVRRVMVSCQNSNIYVSDLAFPNDPGRTYAVSGLSPSSLAPGFKREPLSGKWVHWNGGKTLRVITPPANYRTGSGTTANPLNASATYSVGQTITPAGGTTPSAPHFNGTYGRFNYIESFPGFCVVNSTTEPMYFFKVPPGGL